MRLCLVEDSAVAGLEPLTLTRPVFDLLLGSTTLGTKIAHALGVGPGPLRRGVVIRPYLKAVQRARDPHTAVNDRDWLARGPVCVVNGRWVPPAGFTLSDPRGPWVGLCDGQPACALVGPEQAVALEPGGVNDWFDGVAAAAGGEEIGGEGIGRPWGIGARDAEHVGRDLRSQGES